jgi:hypothetical protein
VTAARATPEMPRHGDLGAPRFPAVLGRLVVLVTDVNDEHSLRIPRGGGIGRTPVP